MNNTDLTANTGREHAEELDRRDPLAEFAERFYTLPDRIYMDGNSLGLMSVDAEESLMRIAEEWKRLGIDGWMGGEIPWFHYANRLAEMQAPLMGAEPDEVVVTGSTTVNLQALLTTFFRPLGGGSPGSSAGPGSPARTKILMDELNFPSDIYAAKGILKMLGLAPDSELVLVPSRDGRFLDEEDIIAHMTEEIAVAVLPAVLYRSGQLLDTGYLARAARDRGVLLGIDCSHSAGAVPHRFDEEGIDFAFWCNYKYFNNGPGGTAGLYVNRTHLPAEPSLAGWFGYVKERQFDMRLEFEPSPDAGAFQIGSPNILSAAPLEGSLKIYHEAGIGELREKSLRLTEYMMYLLDETAPYGKTGFSIGTPREATRRGGHVAVEHDEAVRINEALKARGVVPDFRNPNVIRLAPVPLYTGYLDVWETVRHLREIVEQKEYESFSKKRGEVA